MDIKLQIFGQILGIKLQIFGAEGAENFEKFRVFKGKSAIFGVLRENLAKF